MFARSLDVMDNVLELLNCFLLFDARSSIQPHGIIHFDPSPQVKLIFLEPKLLPLAMTSLISGPE